MENIVIYGVFVILFILALIIFIGQLSEIVNHTKAKQKLHRFVAETVADPSRFEEMDTMVPQFLSEQPNESALRWADDFLTEIMNQDMTLSEKYWIYSGLRQDSISGRWNYAREFILTPYARK